MNKSIIAVCIRLLLVMFFTYTNATAQLIPYVQPMSGTAPSTTAAAQKHSEEGSEKNANTIPAVGQPFAMTQWTPQTQLTENKCIPPYFYKDRRINGFRATHWLSGSCTQDYGSITIMPVVGQLKTSMDEYALPFDHNKETSTPAYYSIKAGHVFTELTATLRCGLMRFTSDKSDSLYLLILPNSDKAKGFVQVNAETGEIRGYNPAHRIYQGWGEPAGFNGWFYIKTDAKIITNGSFRGKAIAAADTIQNAGNGDGLYVGFLANANQSIQLKIGTSFTSLEAAKANLQSEVAAQGFDEILTAAKASWEKALGQVAIASADEKAKRIFYTSMYHAMQHPRLFSDVDGSYPKFAGNYELKKSTNGHYYDDFSMWDIYRAQLPLMEILQPKLVNQWVSSVVAKGTQGGWLPIFPCWNSYTAAMIGDHVTAFIASAYNKGIRNYDVKEAYRLMRKNAFETPASFADYKNGFGRRALPSYLKYGFIPMEDSVQEAFHKKEQVSRTLEYAFDDYALSVVAKGLGKTADYQLLKKRAANYKNVFDKSAGMVRGRYANGEWYQPFKPDAREPYITEGTPRQYTLYVPQDIAGLTALMGGQKAFEKALDSLFIKDEYWHGNEPGHQIPFLYNYTASPWKTQQKVRQILEEEYSDGPGGLSGNDDAGQMSAWYIFAALGFYPVDPVGNDYQISTPLFEKATLQLEGGRKFEIIVHADSDKAIYIKKMVLNGKPLAKPVINYSQIMKGGKLELWTSGER